MRPKQRPLARATTWQIMLPIPNVRRGPRRKGSMESQAPWSERGPHLPAQSAPPSAPAISSAFPSFRVLLYQGPGRPGPGPLHDCADLRLPTLETIGRTEGRTHPGAEEDPEP
eukprot:5086017-Pyramimonas_sp.AAC.1